MLDLGVVRPGTTLYIPFATYDSNDPTASVTMTGLAATDIEIFKDGGTTQRGSDNGYTLLDTDGIDFDGLTGIHGFSVSLADNTTAGFYAAGSQYWVVVSSVTVDAGVVSFIAATFRIGYADAILDTTIATLASQTSFTLTAGPADDNALVGAICLVHDVASAVQIAQGVVSAYTGSSKTVTLAVDPAIFTMAATDNIAFFPGVNVRYISEDKTAADNLELACDNYSATRGLTGTAVPAVASGSAGAVLISGSNAGTTTLGALTVTGATTHTGTTTYTGAVTFSDAIIATAGPVSMTNASNDIKGVFIATNGIVAASIATGAIDADAIADNAIDAGAIAADAGTEIGTAVWATAARTLTAATNITSTGGTTVPQTGDSFARLGAPAGASIAADLVVIDNFVDDLESRVVGTIAAGTHNPQTGDAFARLGAPAGASMSADIAAIEAQTDDIGVAGAGLTAVPWNAAWDAEVESEVDDALGGGTGTALTAIPWNAAWDAEVQSEAQDAITASALATAAALAVIDDFLDTEVALILAAVDTEVNAIKTKTDLLPSGIQKNTALANFEFFMALASDHISAATAKTVTATRSIDGAAFGPCANAVVEVASGVYKILLAAADLNGDVITLRFNEATCDDTFITIKTQA